MREQGVFVLQERLRRGVGGPGDVTQRQVEPGGAPGHFLHHPVQADQPPHDLLAITDPVGFGEPTHIAQDVGKHKPGQARVLHPRREHALHRRVCAVSELAELVDRLPVPVPGQAARPRGILEAVQDPVVGEVV